MITIPFIEKMMKAERFIIRNKYTITNVHFNSTKIQDNGLFFALTQGKRDGHQFIQDAIDNGATTIILSDLEYAVWEEDINYILVEDTLESMIELAKAYRETLVMPIIAITGSNGKTTTKDIMAHLLSSKGYVYKTEGNLNNHIGVPLSLLNMNNSYCFGVLELGMNRAGEIDALAELAKPSIGIITNVGESHIEYLKTTENIAKAKMELIPHIAEGGLVVLSSDIQHKEVFLEASQGKKVVGVGFDEKNSDCFVKEFVQKKDKTIFTIEGNEMETDLKGKHNIQNAALAIAVARFLGIEWKLIQEKLMNLVVTEMRYQLIPTKQKALLINDAYNASPTSMKAAVDTFVKEKGRKIVVLGDMYELGGLSQRKHREVGQYLDIYKKDVEMLVTVGVDAEYIQTSYNGAGKHFDTLRDANLFLKDYVNQEIIILFKASRGMKFEAMINELAEA